MSWLRCLLVLICLLFISHDKVFAQMEIHLDDRDNYAKIANNHFQGGDWDEGKKVVDQGLKLYPNDSDLRMLLGRYYYEHNQYEQARYELMTALKYNANNVNAKQILVNVEMSSKRYSSAICYINELLEVNPYWKGLWMKKIEAYKLMGNQEEANRLLKRLNQIYPEDQNIKSAYLYNLEQEVALRSNRGEIGQAIDLAMLLVEKDPKNGLFYIQLINSCLKAGEAEKALIYVERGLFNLPDNIALINKKADILGEMQRYNEALTFLQLKINESDNANDRALLTRRYNLFLSESAHQHNMSDPYTLYLKVYERNPQDQEAFKYVVGTAMSKGLYDDALGAIEAAKKREGETRDLLVKEREVYRRMGADSKARQITVRLYEMFPDDYDVKYDYSLYRFDLAKSNMAEGTYDKAVEHWQYVLANGEEDTHQVALSSLYNCYFEMGNMNRALVYADTLIVKYPDDMDGHLKKASVYGKQKKYDDAMGEYEKALAKAPSLRKEQSLVGYDEEATIYTKQLIEEYRLDEAMEIIEQWLSVYPESELGVRYAINLSLQMKDYDKAAQYALQGLEFHPNDLIFQVKLAEVYSLQDDNIRVLEMLESEIEKYPYHHDLIKVYSQSSENYAQLLLKDSKPEDGLLVLNKALKYDTENRSLKYWKGVAFEKLHQNDSAYYYQSFYEPGLLEVKDFDRYLRYLKHNSFKNQVGFSYLRSRFSDVDVITSVATVDYTRFAGKDTYTGRVNYAGRQGGKGIQGQAEWSRQWRKDFYTRIDFALANKFFSKIMVSGSANKTFKNEWEVGLTGGFRRMQDDKNMFNLMGDVSKSWEPWWLNLRVNGIMLDSKLYYSVFTQARFNLHHPRNYITVMGSIGSAPDVDVIDNNLYNGFSVTNSMIGGGIYHLINEMFSVGVLGNWYNYEDVEYNFTEGEGKYRNLYNIYLQLNARF